MTTFIKRSDLSRDRSEQRPERFNVGDKVDAAITNSTRQPPHLGVDQGAGDRRGEAGRRAYGSSDSGASLGDIFKAAIKKKEGDENPS